jgi:hypothetical protein
LFFQDPGGRHKLKFLEKSYHLIALAIFASVGIGCWWQFPTYAYRYNGSKIS